MTFIIINFKKTCHDQKGGHSGTIRQTYSCAFLCAQGLRSAYLHVTSFANMSFVLLTFDIPDGGVKYGDHPRTNRRKEIQHHTQSLRGKNGVHYRLSGTILDHYQKVDVPAGRAQPQTWPTHAAYSRPVNEYAHMNSLTLSQPLYLPSLIKIQPTEIIPLSLDILDHRKLPPWLPTRIVRDD